MEGKALKGCPIGTQTFEVLRDGDMLYIDKTEYIHRMVHSANRYFFLSRPRRFGKSLLTSTLKSYFEGRQDLFEGLAIEQYEKEWTKHPVLHFDMSYAKHVDEEHLKAMLDRQLTKYEKVYHIEDNTSPSLSVRLSALIEQANEQTGEKVVVLIDEYDAPLLDVIHEDENLPKLRQIMRDFYSPLKACDPYLRFVFLTGITKFSQLSIFSELNNILSISMLEEYAGICGFTKEEMLGQMMDYIDRLAEKQKYTREEAIERLTRKYDGYHFTWPSPDVFNPYSLLNAFYDNKIDSYWFGSGTPTYLIEMLRKFHVRPMDMDDVQVYSADFDAPTERLTSIEPLLYQSGYITIKDFNEFADVYTLGIPNSEICVGLMRSLLPGYLDRKYIQGQLTIANMYLQLLDGNMDEALRLMQTFLSSVPYCENANSEGHYQQLLYVMFSLFGLYVDLEVRTATGRVDMVLKMPDKVYILELKFNKSAEEALQQIDVKNYPVRFRQYGLPIVKVGVNFDGTTRTLSEWIISE